MQRKSVTTKSKTTLITTSQKEAWEKRKDAETQRDAEEKRYDKVENHPFFAFFDISASLRFFLKVLQKEIQEKRYDKVENHPFFAFFDISASLRLRVFAFFLESLTERDPGKTVRQSRKPPPTTAN
jgi:hypothetical protein